MGVRPPSGGGGGGPDAVEFGIAALDGYLDRTDTTFPATADELVADLGDPTVEYDPSGNAVALSTVLDRVDADRFESRQQFLDAVHPEFERLRRRGGGGLFGWVRSLIPGR